MASSPERAEQAPPKPAQAKTRPNSLRNAASAVFAVTAIVPLMIFVWTLHRLDALSHLQAQVGLALALAIALLGFAIFRRLMGQMSDLIQALGKALDRGVRSAPPPAAAPPAKPLASRGPDTGSPAPAPVSPTTPPAAPAAPAVAAAPAPRAAHTHATLSVPGLGDIQEVHDLGRAMAMLWKAEAAAFTGRRVIVSVRNVPRPIAGTLVEVTDDGLLLETERAERVAVHYTRLASIDADPSRSEG